MENVLYDPSLEDYRDRVLRAAAAKSIREKVLLFTFMCSLSTLYVVSQVFGTNIRIAIFGTGRKTPNS